MPDIGAKDPNGLLKEFTPEVAGAYNAYPFEVQKSAWADWKSSKTADYTAAIVGMPPASPFIATLLDSVRGSLQEAGVKIVADLAPDEPSNVPLQLQQFNEALALKPDIIFYIPIAAEPSVDLAKAAHDAGIPVIAMQVPIDSEYAVNVTMNSVLQAMEVGAGTLRAIGGSGSVLRVAGIPGLPSETFAAEGYDKVLALCPDVTVAGDVTGLFQPSTAQSATLQFLATNPAGVDAVLQSGTMGLGVFNAFTESGLDPAPIADIGATQGLASWASKHPEYPYYGSTTPTVRMGQVMADVGLRVLAGAGPKVNQIVWDPYIVTPENLTSIVDPEWSVTDSTDLTGDPMTYQPDEQLDEFFSNPDAGS